MRKSRVRWYFFSELFIEWRWQMKKRYWAKVGDIVQIMYGRKYPNMPLQRRHAKVLLIAKSSPKNVLVMLRGGETVVVPIGNLFEGRQS
jgi:hypothetical protein